MQRSALLSLLVGFGLPALGQPAPVAASAASELTADGVLAMARAKGQAVVQERKAHLEAGRLARDFKPDCSKELAAVATSLAKETRSEVRQALLVSRLYYYTLAGQTPAPGQVAEVLKDVSPLCPAWALNLNLLPALGEWAPAAAKAYLAEAMAKHPDGPTRRNLLFETFWEALDAKDAAAWKPLYDRLQADFPGTREAAQAKDILESEQKTAVGSAAPAFAVAALGDPATVYTLATFKGKYLLLDFWATWCGPCRAEMPAMHQAWARFGQRASFDLLSLSFDRKVEHIAPFRKAAATPMPWKHAFVEGGFTNALSQAYGVKGIPKPLLIGPDGRIVASGGELRGENLEKTLEKFLGK